MQLPINGRSAQPVPQSAVDVPVKIIALTQEGENVVYETEVKGVPSANFPRRPLSQMVIQQLMLQEGGILRQVTKGNDDVYELIPWRELRHLRIEFPKVILSSVTLQ
jgi:hypothetical protein